MLLKITYKKDNQILEKVFEYQNKEEAFEKAKAKGVEIIKLEELENKKQFKRYWKVSLGYEEEMKIDVDDEDIEKVVLASLTAKKVQTKNAFIDGSRVILIKEDFKKTMGWNDTHELDDHDWNEIRSCGVEELYKGHLASLKEKIRDNLLAKKNNLQLK